MSTTIVLTDALRALPYFSSFTEESVEVPAKPFLHELLANTLEELSIDDLLGSIETAIYFSLDTLPAIYELFWKLGETSERLYSWLVLDWIDLGPGFKPQSCRTLGDKFPALVKAEITRHFGPQLSWEHLVKLGVRCSKASSSEIAFGGNLRLLKWAHHEHNLGWTNLLHKGPRFSFWCVDTCTQAAGGGHLACLQYAHEQGAIWDEYAISQAAYEGRLDCLRYCHENKCPNNTTWRLTASLTYLAAASGDRACLKYVHKQGYPWDPKAANVAARNGSLACLKYLHKHGCPWNGEEVCVNAAEGGSLACLKYAHEHGCPIGANTASRAVFYSQAKCYSYAIEHGSDPVPEALLWPIRHELRDTPREHKN